jgi:trehalose 6-phosphate synthase/phosphatase
MRWITQHIQIPISHPEVLYLFKPEPMINLWEENRITKLTTQFNNAKSRLILLDFDGTLIDLHKNPDETIPSMELSTLLSNLSNNPKNRLFVVTGRNKGDIEKKLGHLPIGIVAEHGAMIKETGKWEKLLGGDTNWKKEAIPIFMDIVNDCPDSSMQEKDFSLTWHFTRVESNKFKIYSNKLRIALRQIAHQNGLKIINGKTTIELISNSINKGSAVRYLIQKDSYEFMLAMGDDCTDEDMFKALSENKIAFTIKIGIENSAAKYNLRNVQEVNHFLQMLESVN